MPMFEVEQYEIHTSKYRVEADTMSAAIKAVMDGEATVVDNSQELIEIPDDYGMPADENRDIADGLRDLGVTVDEVIPSSRTVEEVDGD
jgi:hypothetical protein